jgi:hypothetical protein
MVMKALPFAGAPAAARALLGLALAWAGAAGCSSGSSGGDAASKFVGDWTIASGAVTPACAGLNTPLDLTGRSFNIARGTSTALVATLDGTCMVPFDVSGTTATAKVGSSCQFNNVPVLGSVTATVTAWTVTVGDGGSTLSMDIAGTILSSCNISGQATASRAAPQDGAAD